MSASLHLLLLSLFGSVLALSGGVIFLFNKRLSDMLQRHAAPFAAGVLITVALLGLLPEALEYVGFEALTIMLLSFFGAYIVEHFFVDIHHHSHDHHHKPSLGSIPLIIAGDTIHNFIDGIAIGASFLASPAMGFTTALSSFLHEVPHEIGDFAVLLKNGWNKRKIIIVNTLSASMTVVGAFSVTVFAQNEQILGSLLAIAAGIFLYLGAIDFLPHANDGFTSRFKAIIPLLTGVAIMMLTFSIIPHEHAYEDADYDHTDTIETEHDDVEVHDDE